MKRHSVTVICLFPVTSEARGAGVIPETLRKVFFGWLASGGAVPSSGWF